MTDDALRAAFAAPPAGPGPGCPASDRLLDAAGGRVPPDELGLLLDHVASCGWCAASWSVARQVQAAEAEVVPLAPRRRSRILVGAGVVVALAAAALVLAWPRDPTVIYRSDGAVVLQDATPDVLPRDAFIVEWSAPSDGPWAYDLTVSTADLEPVHTAIGLTEPVHRVPGAALADVSAGATLLCTVVARQGPGGAEHRLSFTVSVAP